MQACLSLLKMAELLKLPPMVKKEEAKCHILFSLMFNYLSIRNDTLLMTILKSFCNLSYKRYESLNRNIYLPLLAHKPLHYYDSWFVLTASYSTMDGAPSDILTVDNRQGHNVHRSDTIPLVHKIIFIQNVNSVGRCYKSQLNTFPARNSQ